MAIVIANSISSAKGPVTAIAPAPYEPDSSPRILMVEDDDFIRRFTTEALAFRGYQVDGAEDGAIAWDALNTVSYDLLITDNCMPRMTGLELIDKLRTARMTLPVIMATSMVPVTELTRFPWLQPTATLVKPYTVGDLVKKVGEVLRAAGVFHPEIALPPNQPVEPPACFTACPPPAFS